MALGPLKLTHEQFWKLTPAEFTQLQEGYIERQRTQYEHTSWVLANIYNLFADKEFKPTDFYNRNKTSTDGGEGWSKGSEEERNATFAACADL